MHISVISRPRSYKYLYFHVSRQRQALQNYRYVRYTCSCYLFIGRQSRERLFTFRKHKLFACLLIKVYKTATVVIGRLPHFSVCFDLRRTVICSACRVLVPRTMGMSAAVVRQRPSEFDSWNALVYLQCLSLLHHVIAILRSVQMLLTLEDVTAKYELKDWCYAHGRPF